MVVSIGAISFIPIVRTTAKVLQIKTLAGNERFLTFTILTPLVVICTLCSEGSYCELKGEIICKYEITFYPPHNKKISLNRLSSLFYQSCAIWSSAAAIARMSALSCPGSIILYKSLPRRSLRIRMLSVKTVVQEFYFRIQEDGNILTSSMRKCSIPGTVICSLSRQTDNSPYRFAHIPLASIPLQEHRCLIVFNYNYSFMYLSL